MKERIREIMGKTALSQQDFAARLGISPATLSSILNGRTNPTNNIVYAIHNAFPDINISWLMFGEGGMSANHDEGGFVTDAGASASVEVAESGGHEGSLLDIMPEAPNGEASSPSSEGLSPGRAMADLFNTSSQPTPQKMPSGQRAGASSQHATAASQGMVVPGQHGNMSPRTPLPASQRGSAQRVSGGSRDAIQEMQNFVDRPRREIREIRIFFSDGTYETFGPSAESAYPNRK
ncbi:MAG: helix-turn-helix transcriptional regulator [Alloprevotella sp.]|nr:helix-turn-helix transcriptional regulator [Alloprevotella sp.]